jgi:hypothetical protein
LDSVKKEITESTYVISFNYTDTVKLYTSNYFFVHGSIEKDKSIILGFARGEIPDLCSGEYIIFLKDQKKEELNYLGFLRQKGCENIKEQLNEFLPHIKCMFSGKGGYDFPPKYKATGEGYDTSNASPLLREYAEENDFYPAVGIREYDDVEEVVIMGHGLEADKNFIKSLLVGLHLLKKIKLFIYEGEPKKEIDRKKAVLKELSNVDTIEEVHY